VSWLLKAWDGITEHETSSLLMVKYFMLNSGQAFKRHWDFPQPDITEANKNSKEMVDIMVC
jgi:hypothetical protein